MRFLTSSSIHLLHDLLPEISQILCNRVVNHLSFYLSNTGTYLYYSPNLMHLQNLSQFFRSTSCKISNFKQPNYEHIFSKHLLATHFQEHLIDEQGTYRYMNDLKHLRFSQKIDIVQEFLRIRCQVDSSSRITNFDRESPPERRRTVYVSYHRQLPQQSNLITLITMNPFYQLPNLNKVLTFTRNITSKLALSSQLQQFCSKHSIKIKLFDHNSNIETLMQFLYHKSKKNILIHDSINNQNELYDLPLLQHKQAQNKTVQNKLNFKYMPQELVVFLQRLPSQSIVGEANQKQILQKMKDVLGLTANQNLIDPLRRLDFAAIEKNYLFENKANRFRQSKLGFNIRRFVTEKIYELNRKQFTSQNRSSNKAKDNQTWN